MTATAMAAINPHIQPPQHSLHCVAGAPYLFGAFLMVICVVVACTIDRRSERGLSEDGSLTQGDTFGIHDAGGGGGGSDCANQKAT